MPLSYTAAMQSLPLGHGSAESYVLKVAGATQHGYSPIGAYLGGYHGCMIMAVLAVQRHSPLC